MSAELLYFVNPMCSWCYGFHAGLADAVADAEGALTLNLALGALRADEVPLQPEQKTYLRDAWARVAAASGRPFSLALLDRDDFIYDTRPASRAVAAVRASQAAGAVDYLGAVQTAFYRDNREVTTAAVLADVARECGLDPAPVRAWLDDPGTGEQLRLENEQVAGLGVNGYPTLLALTKPQPQLVTAGFLGARALREKLLALMPGPPQPADNRARP